MSADNAANKVESIIKRRKEIIEKIELRERHIGYVQTNPGCSKLKSAGTYADIPVSSEFFIGEVKRQIDHLNVELSAIDKKLEAIDAIMRG